MEMVRKLRRDNFSILDLELCTKSAQIGDSRLESSFYDKMWNSAWNKLEFKVYQVAHASLAHLDKHSTLDPVMINIVSSIPAEGTFLLIF